MKTGQHKRHLQTYTDDLLVGRARHKQVLLILLWVELDTVCNLADREPSLALT